MAFMSGSFGGVFGGVSKQPDILRHPGQCSKQENTWLEFSDGMVRRPPLIPVATLSELGTTNSPSYIHWFTLDNKTYFAVFTTTDFRVYDIEGVEQPRVFNATTHDYLLYEPESFLTTEPVMYPSVLSSIQIGEYNLFANNTKKVAIDDTVPDSASNQYITIEISTGLIWGLTYTILYDGAVAATYTTPDGGTITPATLEQTNSSYIAEDLRNQLSNYLGTGSGWNITGGAGNDNVIYMVRTHSFVTDDYKPELFSINDGDGNNSIKLVYRNVRTLADLPRKSSVGHWVRVQGNNEASVDDFYMEYVKEDGSSEGIWKECAKKDEELSFLPSTLPHVLFKAEDDNFYFSALDGGTLGGSVVDEWSSREAGDSSSNPFPSFVDKAIRGMTNVQGRLGLVSSEHFNLSKSADEFNFFSTSATADTDADPIEYAAPGSDIADLTHAVVQSRELTVFGRAYQYAIPIGGVLTRSSSAMFVTTAYPVQLGCRPAPAGLGVFFAFNEREGSGIREYRDGLIENSNRAEEQTAHIPGYLPSDLSGLVSDNDNGVLVAYKEGENKLYIYQFLLRDEQYEVSAWHDVSFKDLAIKSLYIYRGEIYIVAWLHGNERLLKLDKNEEYLVDYTFSGTVTEGVVDSTVCDLNFSAEDLIGVVTSGPYTGMSVEIDSVTSTEISIKEGILVEGETVLIGVPYLTVYSPTMPIIRDANGKAQLKDTLNISSVNMEVVDTGSFEVDVIAPYYDTSTQVFSGVTVGGTFTVGGSPTSDRSVQVYVGHNSREVDLEFKCNTHNQLRITSLEYTGTYSQRGRRY